VLQLFKNIKGDKAIWGIVALLGLFSFLPVYSTSSYLVYTVGKGTIASHIIKHTFFLLFGFGIIYGVHKIPLRYFKGLSLIAMPLVILLLGYTLAQGKADGGTNTSRWISIPIVGYTFQTSTLAAVVLMVYVARYLAKIKDKVIMFKESIVPLWLPVFLVVILILPANFSTAAIIFSMVMMLAFLGGYPIKYLLMILGSGLASLTLFILVVVNVPNLMDNRVDTWKSRVENFMSGDSKEGYQIERAKIAIASGGIVGAGAGKSVMKNSLPQSNSDFIYAIIVEEYGLVGGLALLFFFFLLLFRIVVVTNASPTIFGKLLIVGVGLPIVFQAFINMGVAVELFPVTGQTLPFISSGGTSLWMTCIAIGIVLSASNKEIEVKSVKIDESNPLDVLSGQL